MRSGICSPQPTWAPRIDASASSSWPTATAQKNGQPSLTDARQPLWPTPTTADEDRGNDATATREGSASLTGATATWATPVGRDCKSGQGQQRRRGTPALSEQATLWPTPNVPNGGRTSNTSNYRADGSKQQRQLEAMSSQWPTAITSMDKRGDNERDGKRGIGLQQIARETTFWPTPTAEPYGSSQNGINGTRPSAATPSLDAQAASLCSPPDPLTSLPGDRSSLSGQTSRRLWKTPYGMANTDANGKTGGAGGEFHKQVMTAAEQISPTNTWQTPCAGTNRKSARAMQPSVNNGRRSGGGQSSPPGLEQQAEMLTTRRRRWPSPTTMDAAGFHGQPDTGRTSPNSGQTLAGVTEGSARTVKLNPLFVEWLMGLPLAWTGCGPAAMAWSRWQQQSRFVLLQLVP
jgi:hypothetical protein